MSREVNPLEIRFQVPKTIKMQTSRSSLVVNNLCIKFLLCGSHSFINFKAGYSPNSVAALQQEVRSQGLYALHFTVFIMYPVKLKLGFQNSVAFWRKEQRSCVNLFKMNTSIQNRAEQFRLYKSIRLNGLDHNTCDVVF